MQFAMEMILLYDEGSESHWEGAPHMNFFSLQYNLKSNEFGKMLTILALNI